tara:strand:- start:7206 stop:7790 length:585 start_codon:yes stop_codon:yes gene_type:complete
MGMIPELLSFAGPLKRMAEEKGYTKEKDKHKYREFCQQYGEMKREIDPDYWVNLFDEEVNKICIKEAEDIREEKKFWERCIIVDDCRYLNEIGLAANYNATILFLSFGDRDKEDPNGLWRNHNSESLANQVEENKEYREMFTHYIINNKTTEDLQRLVKTMLPLWCGVDIDTDDCDDTWWEDVLFMDGIDDDEA